MIGGTKRPGKGNNTIGVIYLALIIVGRLVLSTEWYMKGILNTLSSQLWRPGLDLQQLYKEADRGKEDIKS